ncbi:MAG: ABC transporter permease [Ruminococcus sp.]
MKKKTKKAVLLAVLLAAGITVKIFSYGAAEKCRHKQNDQFAAERWDKSAVQLSSFFTEETALSPEDIAGIREQLSFSISGGTEAGSWYDAYSCSGMIIQASGTKRVSVKAELILVSEHYFRIHLPTLLHGNYLTDADISSQRVVLDKDAAWSLFGSSDIAGMEITIGSNIYEATGVVSDENKRDPDEYPKIYMLYSDYPTEAEENIPITCYEAVLTESVEGYCLTCFKDAIENAVNLSSDSKSTKQQYHIVQNTGRFSAAAVWDYLHNITDCTTHTKPIAYPDHENAALIALHRIAEFTLIGISGLILSGAAFAGVCILYFHEIIRCVMRLMKYLRSCFHKNHKQEVSCNESTQKTNTHSDSVSNAYDNILRLFKGK